jgi:hypothetical protein
MRFRFAMLAALLLVGLTPHPAKADATVFLGTTTSPTRHTVKGVAVGVSLLVVGFEFEYASAAEDATVNTPSLTTTSGNVSAQTFGLPGFQLYATTGAGVYREALGPDSETSLVLNNGGGVKVNLAGPLRARVDYRVLSLRGHPQHSTVQRIYAGLNLAF